MYVLESIMESTLKHVMLKIKNHGLRNLRQVHLLEVGLTKIPGYHETLSRARHVGLHVDFHP